MSTDKQHLSPKSNKRKTELLIGLAISLVTLLILLGGLELIAYNWEQDTAQGELGWTLVASRRLDYEIQGTPDNPYFLFKPNTEYLWEGIPVQVNSSGFRTQEFLIPKPQDTFRILSIGDSIAFGWELHQEDTYGKRLEDALNQQDDSVQYEVINAGVPGWALDVERNFLLQEGLRYEPDAIILELTVVNDIYARGISLETGSSVFDWLRDNTYSWPFLTTQMRFLLSRSQGPEAIPVLNPPTNADAYFPLDETSPVWDQVWALVEEMSMAADEANIPFYVIVFPSAFQLNAAQHPDTPQQVLTSRAIENNVNIIDLLSIYEGICENAGENACAGYDNIIFSDVWMHPNTYGHQLAAEALFEAITGDQ